MRLVLAPLALLGFFATASVGEPAEPDLEALVLAGRFDDALAQAKALQGPDRVKALNLIVNGATALSGPNKKLAHGIWSAAQATEPAQRTAAVRVALRGLRRLDSLDAVRAALAAAVVAADRTPTAMRKVQLLLEWLPTLLRFDAPRPLRAALDKLTVAAEAVTWKEQAAIGVEAAKACLNAGNAEAAQRALSLAVRGAARAPASKLLEPRYVVAVAVVKAGLREPVHALLDGLLVDVEKNPDVRVRHMAYGNMAQLCRDARYMRGAGVALARAARDVETLGTPVQRFGVLVKIAAAQEPSESGKTLALAAATADGFARRDQSVVALIRVAEQLLVHKQRDPARAVLERADAKSAGLKDDQRASAAMMIGQSLAEAGDATRAIALGKRHEKRLRDSAKYWRDVHARALRGGNLRGAMDAADRIRASETNRKKRVELVVKAVRLAIDQSRFDIARHGIKKLAEYRDPMVRLKMMKASRAGAELTRRVALMRELARAQAKDGDVAGAGTTLKLVRTWLDAFEVRFLAVSFYIRLAGVQHELGLMDQARDTLVAASRTVGKLNVRQHAEEYERIAAARIRTGQDADARMVLQLAQKALPRAGSAHRVARRIGSGWAAVGDDDKARALLNEKYRETWLPGDLADRGRWVAALKWARRIADPKGREQTITGIAIRQLKRGATASFDETFSGLPADAAASARARAVIAYVGTSRHPWKERHTRAQAELAPLAPAVRSELLALLVQQAARAGDLDAARAYLGHLARLDVPRDVLVNAQVEILHAHRQVSNVLGRWKPGSRRAHRQLVHRTMDRLRNVVAKTDDVRVSLVFRWTVVAESAKALKEPWYADMARLAAEALRRDMTTSAARDKVAGRMLAIDQIQASARGE